MSEKPDPSCDCPREWRECKSELCHPKRTGQTMQLPDIETVASEVHAAWMEGKLAQGVTTRRSEKGEELMVPYGELSEEAKELDRYTVRAVYAAIERLGAPGA